ncbi:hypothetical protein ADUPG1_010759, partial [Aduncisulcus paluster]
SITVLLSSIVKVGQTPSSETTKGVLWREIMTFLLHMSHSAPCHPCPHVCVMLSQTLGESMLSDIVLTLSEEEDIMTPPGGGDVNIPDQSQERGKDLQQSCSVTDLDIPDEIEEERESGEPLEEDMGDHDQEYEHRGKQEKKEKEGSGCVDKASLVHKISLEMINGILGLVMGREMSEKEVSAMVHEGEKLRTAQHFGAKKKAGTSSGSSIDIKQNIDGARDSTLSPLTLGSYSSLESLGHNGAHHHRATSSSPENGGGVGNSSLGGSSNPQFLISWSYPLLSLFHLLASSQLSLPITLYVVDVLCALSAHPHNTQRMTEEGIGVKVLQMVEKEMERATKYRHSNFQKNEKDKNENSKIRPSTVDDSQQQPPQQYTESDKCKGMDHLFPYSVSIIAGHETEYSTWLRARSMSMSDYKRMSRGSVDVKQSSRRQSCCSPSSHSHGSSMCENIKSEAGSKKSEEDYRERDRGLSVISFGSDIGSVDDLDAILEGYHKGSLKQTDLEAVAPIDEDISTLPDHMRATYLSESTHVDGDACVGDNSLLDSAFLETTGVDDESDDHNSVFIPLEEHFDTHFTRWEDTSYAQGILSNLGFSCFSSLIISRLAFLLCSLFTHSITASELKRLLNIATGNDNVYLPLIVKIISFIHTNTPLTISHTYVDNSSGVGGLVLSHPLMFPISRGYTVSMWINIKRDDVENARVFSFVSEKSKVGIELFLGSPHEKKHQLHGPFDGSSPVSLGQSSSSFNSLFLGVTQRHGGTCRYSEYLLDHGEPVCIPTEQWFHLVVTHTVRNMLMMYINGLLVVAKQIPLPFDETSHARTNISFLCSYVKKDG